MITSSSSPPFFKPVFSRPVTIQKAPALDPGHQRTDDPGEDDHRHRGLSVTASPGRPFWVFWRNSDGKNVEKRSEYCTD